MKKKKLKLHFHSNETLLYKNLPMGPMWELICRWKEIAGEFGCKVVTGPSPREEEINRYRKKCTGKDHPIPGRSRTFLEINNKLIYFNDQDWPGIGAQLNRVPGLIDLAIKFQYGPEQPYNQFPFKVVPFTYFTRQNEAMLYKHRKIRSKIVKNKKFVHSVIWAGSIWGQGASQRKAISKYLKENSQLAKLGWWRFEEYLGHACQSLTGAAVRGMGEFCHREIEFMCIGLPFFRKAYNNITRNPILPNVHYYTIGGDEVGIIKTAEHFLDYFEPDGKLREFSAEEWDAYTEIMNNSMKWFDKNATTRACFKLLLEILEENSII